MYLSVNRSGENCINRLHRNFLSLPYTRNQHSSGRGSLAVLSLGCGGDYGNGMVIVNPIDNPASIHLPISVAEIYFKILIGNGFRLR